MARRTEKIELPVGAIGTRRHLLVHRYGPEGDGVERAYIQGSLHADELPGILVCHHLIHLLDEASKAGKIKKSITIVPYANPIGLSQRVFGSHIGRFSLDTGVNFNRDWPELADKVVTRVKSDLKVDDEKHNVRVIRRAIEDALSEDTGRKEDHVLKKTLFRLAAVSDIVLDLHCDTGKSLSVLFDYYCEHALLRSTSSSMLLFIGC